MSVPPIPPPLDQVGGRPFSFYPPILGVEHNKWIMRRATWSEVLVMNVKSQAEFWVPRRFIGEVSRIDDPVMIVGLVKELEYKAGAVWPHERRVIEMPRAVNDAPRAAPESEPPQPAAVVGIRLESAAESRIGRLMALLIVVGIVACVAVVMLFRSGPDGDRVSYSGLLQTDLPFTAYDDYFSVVSRLGRPAEDRWKSDKGELQYRLLSYPDRKLFIVLMGVERKDVRYIGAMDGNWRMIHSVDMPGGSNSASILRKLSRF